MYDMREALKWYLHDNGIKISYIARKTGVSADKLSNIIHKKRGLQADELMLITVTLGIDPLDLAQQHANSNSAADQS